MKRLLTASVAIPALFFILQDRRCTEIVAVISILLAVSEYRTLRPSESQAATVTLAIAATVLLYFPMSIGNFCYFAQITLVAVSLANEGISGFHGGAVDCVFLTLFIFPITRAVSLARLGQGRLLVATVGLCFAADGAGLVIGNFLGRTKLCPALSPGKTVEGFLAAVTVTTLLGIFCAQIDSTIFHRKISGAVFGAAIAVIGSVGDIVESALKRAAGAKDAGNFLPGHGGILDRLDSLAPSFLVAYIWSQGW